LPKVAVSASSLLGKRTKAHREPKLVSLIKRIGHQQT